MPSSISFFAPILFASALLAASTTVRGHDAIGAPQVDEAADAQSDADRADAPDDTSPPKTIPLTVREPRCRNLLALDEGTVCRYAAALSAEPGGPGNPGHAHSDATLELRMR